VRYALTAGILILAVVVFIVLAILLLVAVGS